jgi:hypothetical protein
METAITTAAHFMSCRLIKIEQQRKEKLCALATIKNRSASLGDEKCRLAFLYSLLRSSSNVSQSSSTDAQCVAHLITP